MSFNENLRDELLFQDIQFKEFAGRIDVPYPTFLSYVNYKRTLPRVDIAYRIAQGLDVTVEYLITGKSEDNYKKKLSVTFKELSCLPSNIVSSVQCLIHNYYELYKSR